MHMQIEAITEARSVKIMLLHNAHLLLMGANHRIMRCSQFVGNEQIVPNRHSTKIAKSTV